jgi:sugar/nucleoside kinase (ribokinase family)
MDDIRFDVVGIGNAIVDIIGRCDDAFLARHGATKGSMQLVDADRVSKLYGDMGPAVETSGGSAANTMSGIASFGGRGAFIGKVADDEFGKIFRHDITSAGIAYETTPAKGASPTSRSLILVTPDGERTMHTYLGASSEFDEHEVDPTLIRQSSILYLEGYLFDRPAAKAAFRHAAELAAKAGRRVSMTLSDPFCVDRHRAEFLDFVRSDVDILFANENEINSLYETSNFDEAAERARNDVKIAVLTRSEKGSVILSDGQSVQIPSQPVEVVDTTGAGDLYAAGVLYGLTSGRDLETAGRLGSLAAAEVISHIGPRAEVSLERLARERGIIG